MGLFDRMLGSREPDQRIRAVPAPELRARLLSLNRPELPWTVRDGAPERMDLVAEAVVDAPGTQYCHLKILMRLDEAHHRVLALDQEWTANIGPGGGLQYTQGNVSRRSVGWTRERGEDGRTRWVKEYEFDTRAVKNPLRDTVVAAGWAWKGKVLRP